MDEAVIATELGGDALSSCSEGGNSEETACKPKSEPPAEICGVAAEIAPNAALSRTTLDEAAVATELGNDVMLSCSKCGNSEEGV